MTTEFNLKILVCAECEEEFAFTAGAQEYFAARGLKNLPQRCKSCHTEARRQRRVVRQQPQPVRPRPRPG